MSAKQSYGQTRKFIEQYLGQGACTPGEDVLSLLMSNCLMQMWSKTADDKWWENTWTLDVSADGTVELPDDLGTIFEVATEHGCCEQCPPPPCSVLSTATAQPVDDEPVEPTEPAPKHEAYSSDTTSASGGCSYWCEGSTLRFTTVVEGPVMIRGKRTPDCVLFTTDADGKKTWNYIDLPSCYHTVYAKCLLAFAYAHADDVGLAEWWLSIASEEFDSITKVKEKPFVDERSKDGGPRKIVMNGGGRHKCNGCCPPEIAFSTVEYRDHCTGLVVP